MNHLVEQAIRQSHCSHETREKHNCVGTCEITPSGIILKCSLCGTGGDSIRDDPKYQKLEVVLSKIGIDIEKIHIQTVYSMMADL